MNDRIELIKDKLGEGRWFTSFFWSTLTVYLAANGFLMKLVLVKPNKVHGYLHVFLILLMAAASVLLLRVVRMVSVYREALLADIEQLSQGTTLPSLQSNFLPMRDAVKIFKTTLVLFIGLWAIVLLYLIWSLQG